MYFSHWFDKVTKGVYCSHRPQDNPTGENWVLITEEQYDLLREAYNLIRELTK